MSKEWEIVVAAISNFARNESLKLDDVRDLVLSEITRCKDSGESSGRAYSLEGRRRRQDGRS